MRRFADFKLRGKVQSCPCCCLRWKHTRSSNRTFRFGNMPLIVRCTHAFLQTTQKSATMHALGPSMFSERSVWQHDQLFESFLALNAKKQDTENHSCVTPRRNPGPLGKSNRHCDMYTPRYSHSFTFFFFLNIQFGSFKYTVWKKSKRYGGHQLQRNTREDCRKRAVPARCWKTAGYVAVDSDGFSATCWLRCPAASWWS